MLEHAIHSRVQVLYHEIDAVDTIRLLECSNEIVAFLMTMRNGVVKSEGKLGPATEILKWLSFEQS